MTMNTHQFALSVTVLSIGLGILGCATPGGEPHDMSAEEHAAAAAKDEASATEHNVQFDADAMLLQARCRGLSAATTTIGNEGACWTSTTNPTETHRRQAARNQRQAADHRAVSVALKAAEGRACVGLSDEDRDMSPFDHTEDIASVTPLVEQVQVGETSHPERTGAVVTFRPLPGMSAEWLQRVVDCHLARNASLGYVVPEIQNSPLVPKGAEAEVTSTGTGFAVAIRAKDKETAAEILARAQRLVPLDALSRAAVR